jgi:glycosyltransferase involved in cell wall biosynthesis
MAGSLRLRSLDARIQFVLGLSYDASPMPKPIPPSLQQAYEEAVDRTIEAAARVARGVHGSGEALTARKPPDVVRALKLSERIVLQAWAEPKGLIVDATAFEAKWIGQGRIGGQENDVYVDVGRVFKCNNLSYHLSYADFFDRLALHNLLFPGAPLRFEGLLWRTRDLFPVMSQPFVRAKRGARRSEVESFMRNLGYARSRNDDYQNSEGILVEDLHDENVFVDDDDNLIVIDPVIYLLQARPIRRMSSPKSRHPSRRSLLNKR